MCRDCAAVRSGALAGQTSPSGAPRGDGDARRALTLRPRDGLRVEACTRIIGRAGLGAANLAIAYRGVARQELADFAGALADLTVAIELVPSARAYFARRWLRCELSRRAADRGDTTASRASLALGEADLRRAIAIDPSIGTLEGCCY